MLTREQGLQNIYHKSFRYITWNTIKISIRFWMHERNVLKTNVAYWISLYNVRIEDVLFSFLSEIKLLSNRWL